MPLVGAVAKLEATGSPSKGSGERAPSAAVLGTLRGFDLRQNLENDTWEFEYTYVNKNWKKALQTSQWPFWQAQAWETGGSMLCSEGFCMVCDVSVCGQCGPMLRERAAVPAGGKDGAGTVGTWWASPCACERDTGVFSFCQGDVWPPKDKETSSYVADLQRNFGEGSSGGQHEATKVPPRWHWPRPAASRSWRSGNHSFPHVGLAV